MKMLVAALKQQRWSNLLNGELPGLPDQVDYFASVNRNTEIILSKRKRSFYPNVLYIFTSIHTDDR